MVIINDSIDYALGQPMQKERLLLVALKWQAELEPLIPEEKLNEVFATTVKTHQTSFPVNMHDLINTFQAPQKQSFLNGKPVFGLDDERNPFSGKFVY